MSYGPTWNDVKEEVYNRVTNVMRSFAYEQNNADTRAEVKRLAENEFNQSLMAGLLNQVVVSVDDSPDVVGNGELVVQASWKVHPDDALKMVEFRLGPSGISVS